jgi:glucose-6-phosphate 1-epimerase
MIVVGPKLEVTLKVANNSAEPFEYSCALHSYYNISALENISIEGLRGTTYYNQLTGGHDIQEEDLLQISEPLTRHYLNTESTVVIEDNIFRRRIKVEKSGSKVTTVWNPGEETCAAIADLPHDSFHAFVCVEATNAFEYPVSVEPGESFETSAIIGLADFGEI